MGEINSNMVSKAVILLALAALQYSLAVPTTISDVVPETRFVEHGDVAEGLLCSDAQPQAPRDLTTGASGAKRALGPLNLVPGHADATADGFVHVNTHFHEGAEHKSDAYNTAPPSEGPNGGEYANGHPGWQCADSVEEHDQSGMWAPYEFQHCKDVHVGHTYEISWHVDRACHRVSARAFDAMCQSMQETYSGGGYEGGDLEPHGSRTILSPDWVASKTYPMAGYE